MVDLLYDDELSPEETACLRAQVQACPACLERLAAWSAVVGAYRALPSSEPCGTTHYAILKAARAETVGGGGWLAWIDRLAVAPAFATLALVVVVAGTTYFATQQSEEAASPAVVESAPASHRRIQPSRAADAPALTAVGDDLGADPEPAAGASSPRLRGGESGGQAPTETQTASGPAGGEVAQPVIGQARELGVAAGLELKPTRSAAAPRKPPARRASVRPVGRLQRPEDPMKGRWLDAKPKKSKPTPTQPARSSSGKAQRAKPRPKLAPASPKRAGVDEVDDLMMALDEDHDQKEISGEPAAWGIPDSEPSPATDPFGNEGRKQDEVSVPSAASAPSESEPAPAVDVVAKRRRRRSRPGSAPEPAAPPRIDARPRVAAPVAPSSQTQPAGPTAVGALDQAPVLPGLADESTGGAAVLDAARQARRRGDLREALRYFDPYVANRRQSRHWPAAVLEAAQINEELGNRRRAIVLYRKIARGSGRIAHQAGARLAFLEADDADSMFESPDPGSDDAEIEAIRAR